MPIIVSNIWESVKVGVENFKIGVNAAMNAVAGVIKQIAGAIQGVVNALNALPGAAKAAADGVASALAPSAGLIGGAANDAINNAAAQGSQVNPPSKDLSGGIPKDSGGHVFPGRTYAIGVRAQPEVMVAGSEGEMFPRGEGLGGGNVTIIFQGTGGPTNQGEAEDSGFMIVNALRARGLSVGGT